MGKRVKIEQVRDLICQVVEQDHEVNFIVGLVIQEVDVYFNF